MSYTILMKLFNSTKQFFVLAIILISLPVAVTLVGNKTNILKRAYSEVFGNKAEFAVNLTDSYEMSGFHWSNFAQGGEEKEGMLSAVSASLKSLSPTYIRLDHIYDYYEPVKKDNDGNFIFDWFRLDKELKAITDSGATPFLSLSYMPSAITSGSEVDLPQSWDEWQLLVKNTVEHISGINGLALANVYYEIWNEPDLFGEYKVYGPKNYLTLYNYSIRGAEAAENALPFKIGGPATTALYKSWYDSFLTYIATNNLRIDFYSWHRYSTNISDYEDDIEKIAQWSLKFPQYRDIELIISEYGYDSKIDKGYDGEFSAIHSLSLAATTFNKLDKVFAFEVKDGPGTKQYWGRWGMLTHEKFGTPVKKPRFYAYDFLNRMKGRRYVVVGQGSWVKAFVTGEDNIIRMLLVNYDPFGRHTENVPIHFVNIPSGEFTYRRIDFLGGMTEQFVNINTPDWTVHEYMKANSAAILEIIYQ